MRESLVRGEIVPIKIIDNANFVSTVILLLVVKVEFSFSAREIITEIVSLTISKITVTDIESIHLTLTNEELWYEHEIWLEEAQRSSIIYMFIDIKKLRTYFVRRI